MNKWVNSYDEDVPEKINYKNLLIHDMLDLSSDIYPKRYALTIEGYNISYKKLKETVDRFATCLTDFGIKKGDSVSIILPSMIQCVVAYYSILKIGAIVVLNNPAYTDRELEHQLNDSNSKILITLDLLANRMIDLRQKTKIKQIIYTTLGDYLPLTKSILFSFIAKKKNLCSDVKLSNDVYKWKELLIKYKPNPPKIKLSFKDTAVYQYTGGTTGVSKGVILTHENLSKMCQILESWLPKKFIKEYKTNIGVMPIFHVYGQTVGMIFCIYNGWRNVLIPKPTVETIFNSIKKYKPNFIELVPILCNNILLHKDLKTIDFSSFDILMSGGSPLSGNIFKELEKVSNSVIMESYGLTEAPSITANPFYGTRKINSVGIPLPDTYCKIVDLETGENDLPIGESGELIIKGPQVTKGYLNKESNDVIKNGWFYTGDIATMDNDGYIYIVGRKKDMIIIKGFKVYSQEIDNIFNEYPKVQESCTIGIKDSNLEEKIKTFIVLKSNENESIDNLITYAKTKLVYYKIPSEIEFRYSLPKTSIGKPDKKELLKQEKEK